MSLFVALGLLLIFTNITALQRLHTVYVAAGVMDAKQAQISSHLTAHQNVK
jgi:hypothetical protein